jgi:tellurite methyltransferase
MVMDYGENNPKLVKQMPAEDAVRWNSRYRDDSRNIFDPPRSLLVDHSKIIPTRGLALDIAMGLGSNTNFLLNHGLHVIGVDISYVAVTKVKRKLPNLMAVVADLQRFSIPINRFDVIINFLYLQRDLWLPLIQGLKLGGVIFIECLTDEMHSIHPDIDQVFLLKTGELKQSFFSGELRKFLDILYYNEGWQNKDKPHPRAVASLIARRVA